jgi:hypothetical protein
MILEEYYVYIFLLQDVMVSHVHDLFHLIIINFYNIYLLAKLSNKSKVIFPSCLGY